MSRCPTLFISHGAPDAVVQDKSPRAMALRRFGERFRPRALVVMSGHWEERGPVRVTRWDRASLLYDFVGFPSDLSQHKYPAPGAPALSGEILSLLERARIPAVADPDRPLDHGVWVPLTLLYPSADVPVVEISQPNPRSPENVAAMGEALAPLRDQGVMLVGSGGLVHNLSRVRFREKNAPVDGWAVAFEDWVMNRLRTRDLKSLWTYYRDAPSAPMAAPTPEHIDPLFFALGAADESDRLETVHEGFEYGNLSMRTIAFAPVHD